LKKKYDFSNPNSNPKFRTEVLQLTTKLKLFGSPFRAGVIGSKFDPNIIRKHDRFKIFDYMIYDCRSQSHIRNRQSKILNQSNLRVVRNYILQLLAKALEPITPAFRGTEGLSNM